MIAKIIIGLKQKSTWEGLLGIFTAFGVVISPELAQHIIAIGLTLIGLIQITKDDTKVVIVEPPSEININDKTISIEKAEL